jgi:ABC-type amino acid transport substrate-binding protein
MRASRLPKPKNKMAVLYVALLALSLFFMLSLRDCRISGAPATCTLDCDTVDVALLYSPMGYYVYADTLGGYNYDLLRDIASAEGVAMRFWPANDRYDALRMLENGRYDMFVSLSCDTAHKYGLACSDTLFAGCQVAVMQASDTVMRQRINRWLGGAVRRGTVQVLRKRYGLQ